MQSNITYFTEQFNSRNTYSLSSQLSQFSREVVDLLKRMPGCQMAFSKFIPSYHHHFGRQCRVADFGFTKLLELFEAVPHVLQVNFLKFIYSASTPTSISTSSDCM